MNKFLRKLDDQYGGNTAPGVTGGSKPEQDARGGPPSAVGELPAEVLQYRFRTQRGVNLGSWFSLETWLTPSLFKDVNDAKSEYDLNAQLPAEVVRARLQRHWASFITAGDWLWLVRHGVNTVRLPIGYFHFVPDLAPHLMRGTEYEQFTYTYTGAWAYVARAIEAAAQHGIGVLIDLHGAPGGQGSDGHTGLTIREPGLWNGPSAQANQSATIAMLVTLQRAVGTYANVVGVEVLNEPRNGDHLTAFYDRAIPAMRAAAPNPSPVQLQINSLPLIVSDAWSLDWYTEQFGGPIRCRPLNPLVVDHHLYRAFTPQDHQTLCAEHALRTRPGAKTFDYFARNSAKGMGNLIVGEWSAALHFTSWDKSHDKMAQQADWAHSQLALFEATCAGQFFWTYKKEGKPDFGWGFYSAVEKGIMPSHLLVFALGRSPGLVPSETVAKQTGQSACQAAVATLPHQADRRKFTDGFNQAWQDATRWWYHPAAGGPRATVGFRKMLASVRLAQYQARNGSSRTDFAFDHGFLAAIEAFDRFLRGL